MSDPTILNGLNRLELLSQSRFPEFERVRDAERTTALRSLEKFVRRIKEENRTILGAVGSITDLTQMLSLEDSLFAPNTLKRDIGGALFTLEFSTIISAPDKSADEMRAEANAAFNRIRRRNNQPEEIRPLGSRKVISSFDPWTNYENMMLLMTEDELRKDLKSVVRVSEKSFSLLKETKESLTEHWDSAFKMYEVESKILGQGLLKDSEIAENIANLKSKFSSLLDLIDLVSTRSPRLKQGEIDGKQDLFEVLKETCLGLKESAEALESRTLNWIEKNIAGLVSVRVDTPFRIASTKTLNALDTCDLAFAESHQKIANSSLRPIIEWAALRNDAKWDSSAHGLELASNADLLLLKLAERNERDLRADITLLRDRKMVNSELLDELEQELWPSAEAKVSASYLTPEQIAEAENSDSTTLFLKCEILERIGFDAAEQFRLSRIIPLFQLSQIDQCLTDEDISSRAAFLLFSEDDSKLWTSKNLMQSELARVRALISSAAAQWIDLTEISSLSELKMRLSEQQRILAQVAQGNVQPELPDTIAQISGRIAEHKALNPVTATSILFYGFHFQGQLHLGKSRISLDSLKQNLKRGIENPESPEILSGIERDIKFLTRCGAILADQGYALTPNPQKIEDPIVRECVSLVIKHYREQE